MPPYAKHREEIRYLNTPQGLAFASKQLDLTPEEIEAIVGKYSRGKYVDTLRGAVKYDYYYYGGWKAEGPGEHNGRVIRPGTILNVELVDLFTRLPFKYSSEVADKAALRRRVQYEIEHANEIAEIKHKAEERQKQHREIITLAQKELNTRTDLTVDQREMFENLIKLSKKDLGE